MFCVSAAQAGAGTFFCVFFLVLLGDFCLEKEYRDKESALLIRRIHRQIAVGAFQLPWRAFLTEADSATRGSGPRHISARHCGTGIRSLTCRRYFSASDGRDMSPGSTATERRPTARGINRCRSHRRDTLEAFMSDPDSEQGNELSGDEAHRSL